MSLPQEWQMGKERRNTMTRRESRQEAFCLLFEKTFNDQGIDELIENATMTRDLEISPFTQQLAEGVVEHLEEIDQIIQSKLKKWKLSRISRVSLSALRIAVYEMCYVEGVPVSVSINEAVELTKTYSVEDDASFVNGVLGAVAKDIESEKITGIPKSGKGLSEKEVHPAPEQEEK